MRSPIAGSRPSRTRSIDHNTSGKAGASSDLSEGQASARPHMGAPPFRQDHARRCIAVAMIGLEGTAGAAHIELPGSAVVCIVGGFKHGNGGSRLLKGCTASQGQATAAQLNTLGYKRCTPAPEAKPQHPGAGYIHTV